MDDLQHDIEKYLKGELSLKEMHALEKKALSDPFLADALEGASAISPIEFSSDVRDIRALTRRGKVIPLWKMISGIAAGLVLAVIATFYFLSNDTTRSEHIALNSQKDSVSTQKTEPKAPPVTTKEAPSEGDRAAQQKPVPKSQDSSSPLPQSQSDEPASGAESDERITAEETLTIDDSEEVLQESLPDEASPKASEAAGGEIASAPSQSPAYRHRESETFSSARISLIGRVVADDGSALPGVNVTIKGTNVGTITDEEGKYRLDVDSTQQDLVFSFIGYEEKEVNAKPGPEQQVQLQPDIAQLSEVVVVGYGGEKRDDLEINPIVEFAEPKGGRKAYKTYLQNSLRYPETALNNKVEGRVTVQFTLEPSGQMTDFRILKGLGYGCDDEVIRLIKEGPKWNPSRRNTEPVQDKVKVRLRFRLPK